MDTVVTTKPFDAPLEAMVSYCRSLSSREKCWPGAQGNLESQGTLYYQLAMHLKAATITDLDVEEILGPEEVTEGGVVFSSTWRLTWPKGIGKSISEYRFTAGSPNTLQFTYSYEPPSTDLIKTKNLPKFHSAMEHVAGRYVEKLAEAVAGQ
jgi:hypothetical protein